MTNVLICLLFLCSVFTIFSSNNLVHDLSPFKFPTDGSFPYSGKLCVAAQHAGSWSRRFADRVGNAMAAKQANNIGTRSVKDPVISVTKMMPGNGAGTTAVKTDGIPTKAKTA